MSLRSFESTLTWEARGVLNNRKLRVKDIVEWRTGEITPVPEGEVVVKLPMSNVWVCVKKENDKR